MKFDYAQNLCIYMFGSDLYNDWTVELKGMANRILSMRKQLYEALQARGLV